MRCGVACRQSECRSRNYGGIFDLARMTAELEELEAKMGVPTFWNDTKSAASTSRKKVTLERELIQWREIEAKLGDLQAMLELAEEGQDTSLEQELTTELHRLETTLSTLRVEMLLSGELDSNNAIMAIHPGAGGTESQDLSLIHI